MRIIVHGQQAFGQAVLDALLDRGEEVVGVYTAPDTKGAPDDPLKASALSHELPVFQPKSFRKEQVWDQMRSLDADLCVMAYVTKFVPEEALNIPTLGTIQYHPSLLPMHKGPSSINWPIIFGEKKTGLSIFWPDNGLDTGPILLQKEVDISPDDTLGSVYFNHLFPLGVDAMLESVDLVKSGEAEKIPQDPEAGTYEGWCRAEQAEIDWSKNADKIYDLIRGCNPQPGAWTQFRDKTLQIFDARLGQKMGSSGEVLRTDDVVEIAANNGSIEVLRVRWGGGPKIPASDFVQQAELSVGDALN